MRIALTYDLRDDYRAMGFPEEALAEFDQPRTIEAIDHALRAHGHQTERVGHVRALAAALARGQRWDLVFNIAEGVRGIAREAQVPALLDAFDIPYTFSDPLVCALTLHKAMTKRVVRDHALPTPDFRLVESEADPILLDPGALDMAYPLFAKPVAEGTSKGIGPENKLRTPDDLARVVRRLLRQHRQPVIVERFLPGREVTVGITGTGADARAVGVLEVVLLSGADQDVYTYANKENSEERCEYRLLDGPQAGHAADLALAVWRALGARDAGRVDLRQDDTGDWSFLEVNPLPGLHPEHSDLPILASLVGLSYEDLIGRILHSASARAHDDPSDPADAPTPRVAPAAARGARTP